MDASLFRAMKEIEESTDQMTPAEYFAAPSGKWNPAEILEHLARTFGGTAKLLEQRLASPDADPVPAPDFKQRLAILVVCTLGYFPSGRKSPKLVEPTGQDGVNSRDRILENLRRMDQVLSQAERRWGRNVRVAVHPVIGPLTVEQWRRFHMVHTLHHMKQLRERRSQAMSAARPASAA